MTGVARFEHTVAVDPAFDLGQEVAAGVCDTDGAWRFIVRFAAACGRPVAPGDGCDDAELREAEQRLGLTLPRALRQLYGLIGRRDDLTSAQDRLLRPEQLRLDEMGRVLVFRVENQGVASWGVEVAAVERPDPPVVFRSYASGPTTPSWRPFLQRTSVACVEMVLSEWMLSSPGLNDNDNRPLDDVTVSLVEQRFSQLPVPGYPMWALPTGPPTRWFWGMGAVLREDARSWIWVRAASPNAIASVRKALPGEWIMLSEV